MRWWIFLPVRVVGVLARYGVAGAVWLGIGVVLWLLFSGTGLPGFGS